MKTLACTAAVLAALCLPAAAAEEEDFLLETAADLADLCDEPENTAAIHMCHGFLVGVHQMHAAITESLGVTVYCIPTDAGVTRNTVAADFAEWANATPAAATMSAREGLLTWARQRYPCN